MRHGRTADPQLPPGRRVTPGRKEGDLHGCHGVLIERFFRSAAGVDVDKDDLRRYGDFVNNKLYDLLVIGQAHAKANRRDIIPTRIYPSPRASRRASTGSAASMRTSS